MLGPTLSRMEQDLAIPGPTDTALHGHSVISLHFSADWCQPCLAFTPVLEKLYAAQRARGAQQLEVVLVSRCREAKGTKYYRKNMPWLAMWHDADDEVGMETRTSSLMAKYNITSIPALVLLDKRGGLICVDTRDKCVANPEGRAFPWRYQSQSAQAAETGSGAGTARGVETRALGQPGVARWLISTSRHRPGCNQNPHAQGPKYSQGARKSDRR